MKSYPVIFEISAATFSSNPTFVFSPFYQHDLKSSIGTYSANGGTSLGQHGEVLQCTPDSLDTPLDLSDVAGEFLSKGQWGSVLQMGSSDLNNVVEALLLLLESVVQFLKRGDQRSVDLDDGSDVHGGREATIRSEWRSTHVSLED